MTYILIYRQAVDTPAKREALRKYSEAYISIQKPQEDAMAQLQLQKAQGTGGSAGGRSSQSTSMAMNNVAQSSPMSTGIATIA